VVDVREMYVQAVYFRRHAIRVLVVVSVSSFAVGLLCGWLLWAP
jgi:hypothetical protein